ncbi:Bax inhibitor-1/YccA family protein [Nonomuraea endophytica]|uniref:Bax inhibitor-1/YccA family protein n=1 Tax=Nonomuraea endophytica TaxID=714136 RepID=UPI0037CB9420
MQSKNPVFSKSRSTQGQGWAGPSATPQDLQNMYNQPSYAPPASPAYRTMTLDDVVIRGFITLGVLVAAAGAAWILKVPIAVAVVSAIIALVLGLVASFKQSTNPALILGYAVFEGVFLGALSSIFEQRFPGIVLNAVIGTMMAFLGVLAVYTLRIVRVTPKLVRFVVAAAIGALGLILVNWIAAFFMPGGLGLRTDSPIGIIFSGAMILLGCFFLLLDFDSIEQGVKQGAPEKFAWQCVFGLTLSLVWIYLEVLRFVSYFSGDD